MPYITPESAIGAGQSVEISIPVDLHLRGAILGQILDLCRPYFWEQTTGISVADTVAAMEEILESISTFSACSGGSMPDYTLQSTDTLVADASSYTLTNLDQLDGRDLRIEWMLAGNGAGEKNFEFICNGLTTSIYFVDCTRFRTSTSYYSGISTYARLSGAIRRADAESDVYSHIMLDIPNWKDNDRFPLITGHYGHFVANGLFACEVRDITDLQSMTFNAQSGDIIAGSRVAVYTRGT